MAEATKANTQPTKSTAPESSPGLTVDNTREIGKMVSNMEKAIILIYLVIKERDIGKKGGKLSGWIMKYSENKNLFIFILKNSDI